MNKSFKYVNERNKNEIRKWIRTQLLQENSIFVCPFLFFYFSHFFVMIWWLLQILYSFSYSQFKFLVSEVDFSKPCSCLKAKTWFVKINWRAKELALTVGKGLKNFYKSTDHHKKVTDLKKPHKAQRGTVHCNNFAHSHILFSIYFLTFTFLTLLFIFAAITFACLRLCANRWKQRLKNETRINNLNAEWKMRTESDWEENYCKGQSLSMCYFCCFFLQSPLCVIYWLLLQNLYSFWHCQF